MNKIMLADGSSFDSVSVVTQESVEYNGTYVKGIKLVVTNTTMDALTTALNDETKLGTITDIGENNSYSNVFTAYQKFASVTYDASRSKTQGAAVYVCILVQSSDVKELIEVWQKTVNQATTDLKNFKEATDETINATVKKVQDIAEDTANVSKTLTETTQKVDQAIPNTNIDTMSLDEAKAYRIQQSKDELEAYLISHPQFSKAHDTDGAYYTVTSEKQQLLASGINLAMIAAAANNTSYKPSWNSVGKACTYDWTLLQLQQLALEMGIRIKPIISLQQDYELEIKACTDIAAIKAIVFDYASKDIQAQAASAATNASTGTATSTSTSTTDASTTATTAGTTTSTDANTSTGTTTNTTTPTV